VIIQAAAQIYGIRGFHKYPADILSKDILLQQNLLWESLCKDVKRFISISSSMVYERAQNIPVKEEDANDMRIPLTDYGLSKLVGERLCKAFKYQYGLDYTIWRPFNIITPYEKAEKEIGISHVFADFISRIIIEKQNPMRILGDGEQIRCFTWVDDVARGIVDNLLSEKSKCDVFNLGNPEPVSMKELAIKIYRKGQERGIIEKNKELKFNHFDIYDDDVRVRIPDIDKAKRILNWRPTIKLDEALDRCIDETIKK